jgi:hypothetical protein
MWKRIKDWWAAEGAMVGFQGMSDRMLADMGLEREGLRERIHGRAAPACARRGGPRPPVRATPVAGDGTGRLRPS